MVSVSLPLQRFAFLTPFTDLFTNRWRYKDVQRKAICAAGDAAICSRHYHILRYAAAKGRIMERASDEETCCEQASEEAAQGMDQAERAAG